MILEVNVLAEPLSFDLKSKKKKLNTPDKESC